MSSRKEFQNIHDCFVWISIGKVPGVDFPHATRFRSPGTRPFLSCRDQMQLIKSWNVQRECSSPSREAEPPSPIPPDIPAFPPPLPEELPPSAGPAQTTPINHILILPPFPKFASSFVCFITSFWFALSRKVPAGTFTDILEETNPKSSSLSCFCFSYTKHRNKRRDESNRLLSHSKCSNIR